MYKITCAWCGAIIRESEVADSHGICDKCSAVMRAEAGLPPVRKDENG